MLSGLWPVVYKPPKLAIPQKPFYARNMMPAKNRFFGVQVKLYV